MADDEYARKLASLQQYVPFLENMIAQLKDPNKKNREQQLAKMESLYAFITDKKKKLKLETLNKCEEVISKLYGKVKPKVSLIKNTSDDPDRPSTMMTPASPSPPRESLDGQPRTIPTERIDVPKVDIYASAAESLKRSQPREERRSFSGNLPDISKPPISLEDLKTLEDDVHDKINENATLAELTNIRNKLAHELIMEDFKFVADRGSQQQTDNDIDTTVRNNLSLSKKNIDTPKKDESPKKHIIEESHVSTEAKTSIEPVKTALDSTSKPPKIVSASDSIFGSVLSHIDDKILGATKKRDDRRSSSTGKEKETDQKESSHKVKETGHKDKEERRHSKGVTKREDSSDRKHKDKKREDSVEKKERDKRRDETYDRDKSRHRDDKAKDRDPRRRRESSDKNRKESQGKEDKKKEHHETHKEKRKEHSEKDDRKKVSDDKSKDSTEIKDKCDSKDDKERKVSEVPAPSVEELSKIIVKKIEELKPPQLDPVRVKVEEPGPKCQSPTSKFETPTSYKRLADKFNPKPRRPTVEAEVDCSVTNSIEENMKTAIPPKLMMPSVALPVPPPPSLIACSQMEPVLPVIPPQLPSPANNIDAKTSHLIQTVVSQMRPTDMEIPPSPMPFSPHDNFISEYARDDFAFTNRAMMHFGSPPQEHFKPNQPLHRPNLIPIPQMQTPTPFLMGQQNNVFPAPGVIPPHNQNFMMEPDFCPPSPHPNFGGAPMMRPEGPQYQNDQFGMPLHQTDLRRKLDRSCWDRNNFAPPYRGASTYREYKQMKENQQRIDPRESMESRDPRDPREIRDPREMRDPREIRDPREVRDPREKLGPGVSGEVRDPRMGRDPRTRGPLDRDPRSRGPLDQTREQKDPRDIRDPRLNRDRAKSRESDFRDPRFKREEHQSDRPSRFDSRFDRMYSETGRSRSRSRSRHRYEKDTFTSPLDDPSLYSNKEGKTGKGYGVQNFRIPKIRKDEVTENDKTDKTPEVTESSEPEKRRRPPTPVPSVVPMDLDDDSSDKQETTECEVHEKEVHVEADTSAKSSDDSAGKLVKETVKKSIEDVEETPMPDTTVDLDKPKIDSDTRKEIEKASETTHEETKTEHQPESSKAPAEQTILAQFFANLLTSQNKKDKKTALYSLISTFSDSFSPKELSKITKIIKHDDDDVSSGEEEDSSKKETKQPVESKQLETPELKETTTEGAIEQETKDDCEEEKPIRPRTRRRIRRLSSDSSPVKDIPEKPSDPDDKVTTKEDDAEEEAFKVDEHKESDEANETGTLDVVVSVGERIKSRKRNTTPPKRKLRNELDKLHEDIQDMFIRDGVLTATGKRMCRILKDDPNMLGSTSGTKTPPPAVEEPPKIRKKPGPKSKTKPALDTEVKSMSVVLPKLPDACTDDAKKSARRCTRSMVATDNADESSEEEAVADGDSSASQEDSEGSDTEKGKRSELDKVKDIAKTKKKRRIRNVWASGIVRKAKCKTKKDQPTADPETESENVLPTTDTTAVDRTQKERPDKSKYVDFGHAKAYHCVLCKYSGKFITTHYKTSHPECEVLSARFKPETAAAAIEDSKKNLAKYEAAGQVNASRKVEWLCRFCDNATTVQPAYFYDHLSTHTGEYRHCCPHCDTTFCAGKSLKFHMKTFHNNEPEKPVQRKPINNSVMFGYLCAECNYIQMHKENVEEHISRWHSKKTTIYKVNLSSKFCDNTKGATEAQAVEQAEEDKERRVDTPPPCLSPQSPLEEVEEKPFIPLRKKPGPKSKTCGKKSPQRTKQVTDSSDQETDAPPKPERKKPGPKPGCKRKRKVISELDRLLSDKEKDGLDVEDVLDFGRSKRAAKEKATEKLRNLMDIENPQKRKSFSSDSQKKNDDDQKVDENTDQVKTDSVKPKFTELLKIKKEPELIIEEKAEGGKNEPKTPEDQKLGKSKHEEYTLEKSSDVDLNVFTCKTDLIEENRQIEEERLRKMEELNNSVKGSRASLNFIDKLCTRLSNKDDIIVKQESLEVFPNTVFSTEPVLVEQSQKSPALPSGKKPLLDECEISLPASNFDVTEKNDDTISNMIAKLKGMLAPVEGMEFDKATEDEDNSNDPFGGMRAVSTAVIGGLVKITKFTDTIKYHCLVASCSYITENLDAYQWHCKTFHGTQQQMSSTICETCGAEVQSTVEASLLENLFKHSIAEHVEFLKPRTESEPDKPKSVLRLRRLSGDALSLQTDYEQKLEDFEEMIQVEAINILPDEKSAVETTVDIVQEASPAMSELELSEDNPFPFKIADVVSLADQQTSLAKQQTPPPLAPIAKPPSPSHSQLIVKEARMTPEELKNPRKTQKAMQKFILAMSDLYKCPHYYCMFSTTHKDFLERHLKAHKTDQDVMVPCVYCDMKTPWEHVPNHIDVRHAASRFACSYCLYRAVMKDYVLLHQEEEHPNKPYSVVALPPSKSGRKFAVTEQKLNVKKLCEPYRCQPKCVPNSFLFFDEFSEHIRTHHQDGWYLCQHKDCMKMIPPSTAPKHWREAHKIGEFQCGYCRTSSLDQRAMCRHLAVAHQNHTPEMYVRLSMGSTPAAEQLYFGYTNEAFKVLRRITTMPNLYPGLSEQPLKNKQTSADPKLQLIPVGVKRAFSLVTTTASSTLSAGNIIVVPAVTSSTNQEIAQVVASQSSTSSQTFIQLVKVPSIAATNVVTINQPTPTSTLSKANTSTTSSTGAKPGVAKLVAALPTPEAFTSKLTESVSLLKPLSATFTPSKPHFATPIATTSGAGVSTTPKATDAAIASSSHDSSPGISDEVNSPTHTVLSTTATEDEDEGEYAPLEQVILGTAPYETSGDASALGDDGPDGDDPLSVSLDPLASSADPLTAVSDPLDINESSNPAMTRDGFSSDDEGDVATTSKDMANEKEVSGLLGYQLYRCALCPFSASNQDGFRNHHIVSTDCRVLQEIDSPFMSHMRMLECVHCGKRLRTISKLIEHINGHGKLSYTCSLCEEKSATVYKAKMHMKSRHNVSQTMLSQVQFDKDGVYVLKPKLLGAIPLLEQSSDPTTCTPKKEEITYLPQDIDSVPHRSIFSTEVRCGVCSYSTKVRTNLVRHLQFHQQEKDVPTTAPVNPVPCLEKNEKMFDKMVNLAGSSHATSSRMGGGAGKTDAKAEETIPDFVPSHHRYVCCADGCNYICPEEGNLRHHIAALHEDELALKCRCPHCSADLGAGADTDAIIRHLKLHGRQLYRCSRCDFVHNQRHKVDKHVADLHAGEISAKLVVVRNMESEPQDSDTSQPSTSASGAGGSSGSSKSSKPWRPWRCCFCKYRSNSEEAMRQHCTEKHDVDCQYKCALCAFKTNDKSAFHQHFDADHENRPVDIVYVYLYLDDQPKDQEQSPEFDTTPLWQRDRPRVRHIRGILFDDILPSPSKGKKAPKSHPATPDASQPGTSTSRSTTPLGFLPKGSVSPKHTPKSPTKQGKSVSKQQSQAEQETARSNLDLSIDAVVAAVSAHSTEDAVSGEVSNKVTDSTQKFEDDTTKEREEDTKLSADVSAKVSEEHQNDDVIVIEDEDSPPSASSEKIQVPLSESVTPNTIKQESDSTNSSLSITEQKPVKRRASEALATVSAKMAKPEIIDLVSNEEDEYSDDSLKKTFGHLGFPLHKQLKCPVCCQFKSKRISDFIFHMYKEKKIYRFKCLICGDESITYRYMYKHVVEHTNSTSAVSEKISPLPPNSRMEAWLQLLITYQTTAICRNLTQVHSAHNMVNRIAKCHTCEQWFKSDSERNEHCMFHWNQLPYSCETCQFTSHSKKHVKRHIEMVHPNSSTNVIVCAPTIASELKFNDGMHMDEVKVNDKCHVDAEQKNPQKETTQKELDLPAETLDNWIQQLQQAVQNEEAATSDAAQGNQEETRSLEGETNERVATIVNRSQLELVVDEEKLETLLALKRAAESDMDDPLQLVQGPSTSLELMTVSKTAEVAVPLLGDVFCCESCVFMSNSEPVTEQHVRDVHFSHGKYKVLNTLQCEENSDEYVACQWCDEAGDEIRIRKHFMQSHPANKFNIYRFSCAYCNRKFLQLAGLRMHNQRMHPQYPIRFESVKEKLVGRDVNPVSATATKRQRYYPKQTKRYQCPMCSYCRVCGPEFMSNVRSHLRTHFKIFKCVMCDEIFPRRAEASDHQRRIHPRIPGCIKTEVSESMLEVWQSLLDSAEVVEVPTATTSATAATTSSLTPSDEDSSSTSSCAFANATSRNIAKKSTSASHQPLAIGVPPPAAEMEPFSYYGTEEEPLFLQDIMTKVELNGVHMNLSADKLARIFDLGACVLLEDCKNSVPSNDSS